MFFWLISLQANEKLPLAAACEVDVKVKSMLCLRGHGHFLGHKIIVLRGTGFEGHMTVFPALPGFCRRSRFYCDN